MARLLKKEGNFGIYELTESECKMHGREYPTIVCWDKEDHENIGNMSRTENETETLDEMVKWCKEYSY